MREIVIANSTLPQPSLHDQRRADSQQPAVTSWVARYGQKHRMQRVTNWPAGVTPLRKVRLYWRSAHWVLQWWEPSARKNVAERVNGDLVAAVSIGRDIDRRLFEFKTSGRVAGRVGHNELVRGFIADLEARADAGQIEPRSVARYQSALARHYLPYTKLAQTTHQWPMPAGVNREFALGFCAFLTSREVSPNGSLAAAKHAMRAPGFVFDAARAMYEWAADPDRGNVLGEGFRNPFRRGSGGRKVARDPFGEPDVTIAMAAEFLEACDNYQLRLFSPIVFCGLRAAEPAYLFGEYLDKQWLKVPCNPDLGYVTKGRRDKRLPLFEPMTAILGASRPGLLFVRRAVAEAREAPILLGWSLEELAAEIQRRVKLVSINGPIKIALRQKIRDQVLFDAGGIAYDHIQGEFQMLARRLQWLKAATLKDLRHLFATAMAAAGMPEAYRQYLMGHATTSAVIGVYTHLNRISEQYRDAIGKEMGPLLEILRNRLQKSSELRATQ